MKKLILFLLLTVAGYGQVSTGNETYFDYGIQVTPASLQVPTTTNWISTFGTDGTQGKVLPQNISIPQIPVNYTPITSTIGGHLAGIDAKFPTSYTKVVYVNNNNPNGATIFDLNNPPVTNDNLLKANTGNLYIGLDTSTWVYNSSTLNYVTKPITSDTSNFYNAGTAIPAGNSKNANIYRLGNIGSGAVNPTALFHAYKAVTGSASRLIYAESNLTPTVGVTMNQGVAFTQANIEDTNAGYPIFGYNVNPQSGTGIISATAVSADTGTVPLILMQGQKTIDAGGTPSAVVTRPIFGISNFNIRLLTGLANGSFGINTTAPITKFDVVNTSIGASLDAITVANTSGTAGTETGIFFRPSASVDNTRGARISAVQNGGNAIDIKFSTGSGVAPTEKMRLSSLGVLSLSTAPTTSAGTYDILTRNTSTGVFEKVTSASVATIASPTFTGDPKAPTPTAGDNDTSIATTAFVTGAIATAIPYKKYVILISQTSTSAPTVTVLENNTGETPTISYLGVGLYKISFSSLLNLANVSKLYYNITQRNDTHHVYLNYGGSVGDGGFVVSSRNNSNTYVNGALDNNPIEIRVYP